LNDSPSWDVQTYRLLSPYLEEPACRRVAI